MDQHPRHAERVGDQAGVLAAGAAEAVERVAGDVVAALHGNLLDGVGHVLDRDLDETVGDLFRRHLAGGGREPDLLRQIVEVVPHGRGIERLILTGSENLREELRQQFSHHHIGVGHRQRPAAPVAGRSGIGAGRVRADAETGAVEMQDRAAAGGDRVDEHHRRAHAHAGDFGFEGALVFAVKVRDIGRGAAHVEADQVLEAGLSAGLRHADHAAGRARENGVLALEQFRRGQPARRHHEHQPRLRFFHIEVAIDLRHVAPQDRRQIGVHHRGIAAADQLDQRRDLVADRDLAKAKLARQRRHLLLVLRKAVGVHEHDRHRIDAVGLGRFEIGAHRGKIGRALHRAVGAHALVDFGDALVEHVGLDDLARENLRPRLVADLERVAEALGDQAAACGRPCARAARWWQPWCPFSPRRRGRAGSARRLASRAGRGCPAPRRRHKLPGFPTAACARSARRPAAAPPRR